jgi:hypothetical protein
VYYIQCFEHPNGEAFLNMERHCLIHRSSPKDIRIALFVTSQIGFMFAAVHLLAGVIALVMGRGEEVSEIDGEAVGSSQADSEVGKFEDIRKHQERIARAYHRDSSSLPSYRR